MSEEQKYCLVCGKALAGRQKKYCSKKCMGLSKQGYKICVVCGKKFKDSKSNQNCCCSHECSKIHRQSLNKTGVYHDTMNRMHQRYSEKIKEIGNHQELFDGTINQAYDGIRKIKSSLEGKRKKPSYQWKGWKLISCSDNKNRYKAK